MTDKSTQVQMPSVVTTCWVILALAFVRTTEYAFDGIRPWIVICGLVCLLISHNGKLASDKPLLFLAIGIGLAPIAGWIPGASRAIDPILMLSTLSIIDALLCIRVKKLTVQAYLIPPVLAAFLGAKRWWFFRDGNPADIMSRLISGWDHFGHFYLFINSIRFNSFVARTPEFFKGMTSYDRQYPAGIQMNWSQWWPQDHDLVTRHPMELLRQYMTVVILTAVVSTVTIVVSISRVYGKRSIKFAISLAASALVSLLAFAGPLSITIWNGFPNFLIAIAGVVAAYSIMKRPLENRLLQLVALFGSVSITSYNWYPLLVPIALYAFAHFIETIKGLTRRNQIILVLLSFVLGLLAVAPIVGTFAFGVKHLTVDGGITQLPPNMVIAVLGLSLSIAVIELMSRKGNLIGSLTSPLLIAPLFQLVVTTYVRISQHSYPYYVQKIAIGTVFICILCIPIHFALEIERVSVRAIEFRRINNLIVPASMLMIAVMTTQIFGYIGPDWKTLAPSSSSIGLHAPQSVNDQVVSRDRTTNIVANISNDVLAFGAPSRDCLVLVDTDMQDYDPVLMNYWVGVVTWTLTEEHLLKSQSIIPLKTGITDPQKNARIVEELLNPKDDCPIVPENLALALVSRNSEWAQVIWIINSDGHIVKFKQ